ncbi:hypothetical protein BaRGS_00005345 [Batillaria attramentaria]|uniref:Uncharacterized protein n=1 Tax=Batillaria attramentaria TaxID=370345 RepID=A0ABD0LWK1_9CAEN
MTKDTRGDTCTMFKKEKKEQKNMDHVQQVTNEQFLSTDNQPTENLVVVSAATTCLVIICISTGQVNVLQGNLKQRCSGWQPTCPAEVPTKFCILDKERNKNCESDIHHASISGSTKIHPK